MAMYDWNQDGKKDEKDNFIGYQIFKDGTDNDNNTSHSHKGGISTFGAIVSVIAGLVLQAVLYTALGIEVKDVPLIVILMLWFVFSIIVAAIVDKIGL